MDITQLEKLYDQISKAHEDFLKLPEPKGTRDTIKRISQSGSFVGMMKLLNYITGSTNDNAWQDYLKELTNAKH